ncbi:MAG: tetratricopeptide (TPR) repeat protein [Paracoccaceae bacterium]
MLSQQQTNALLTELDHSMMHDIFGQQTSLTRASTLAHWNAAQLAFLAHGATTPDHLAAALAEAPEFAHAQAVKGMFYLLLGRRELLGTAQEALAAATQAAKDTPVTKREARYVEALKVWMAGSPQGAIHQLEQVLVDHPDDTLSMKLGHAIRFVLGDSTGMLQSVERVMPAYDPKHPGHGYLLGCHAFALEENGAYERAENAGRQALWTAPDDAWGLHAVAHVHDMTANAAKGLDWLEGREAAWAHCNNFRYHVWWHKALMQLDLGQIDEALALYDQQIRKDHTDDYRDISNGTALLMRLELEGVDVGHRWEEMADISATRTEDGCLIFADLHYLLALNGDHRQTDAARLIQRIRHDGQVGQSETAQRMAHPGTEAALGLEAFSEARFAEAFVHLARARPTMQLAGGSHAQRDVFERMTIDAGLRAGLLDQAEHILNERQAQRGGTEDGYCAGRRDLIAAGRGPFDQHSLPA